MTKSNEILNSYKDLARKLGKLPTVREFARFAMSERQVCNAFGSFKKLKSEALLKYPFLKDLEVAVKVTDADVSSYRLSIQASKNDKYNSEQTRLVSALDYIAKFSEGVFNGRLSPNKQLKKKTSYKRALVLTLSDLHFGSDIMGAETGFLDYGKIEESRRFAEVIRQTIQYKPQYRKDTKLVVNLLGDIIQHKLHDAQDAAPLAEQVCRAIHLLNQGLARLAESFSSVEVQCATGNHGRDTSRHKQRATSGKWDSVETVIYFAIKESLSKYKNMTVNIPKTPHVIYDVMGHKAFATHGDTVLKPGNPGKNLNIASLENQINRINASLKDLEEVQLVFVGHTHCASVSQLNTGAALVTNGALPATDPYAVSLGFLENRASQTLVECTEEYPLGDIRFIRVGEKQDLDVELDKLIKPWENF